MGERVAMMSDLKAVLATIAALVTEWGGGIEYRMRVAEQWAEHVVEAKYGFDDSTLLGRAAQTGAVLTVVVLGIVLLIGTLIYSEIESALPQPSNNKLANASGNVTDTFADTMDLAPVIMIVLIAGVVLAVVQRFR